MRSAKAEGTSPLRRHFGVVTKSVSSLRILGALNASAMGRLKSSRLLSVGALRLPSRLALVVFTVCSLALAQTSQQPKAESPPPVTQIQIVDLQLDRVRIGQPLVLFDRAVKDEKGKCRVHHQRLKVALVPIVYGLLPGSGKDYDTERREFPNAITSYEGGCIVMAAKQANVLQCQKCLKARKDREVTPTRSGL